MRMQRLCFRLWLRRNQFWVDWLILFLWPIVAAGGAVCLYLVVEKIAGK